MIKRLAILLAASLMLCAAPSWAQDEGTSGSPDAEGQNELTLVVGENKTIAATGVKNYSEGVKGVVEVKLTTDNAKFVVAGKKPGTTTLLLINKDDSTTTWVINVFARSPDAVRRELTQLLGEMPGVRVRRVGARFFIEGGVASE
ncbi:MAG: pilus assembly protein N-terminal domain-containing protein, partial [Polyangiaceae bacterium]|nr:pilus assembly protein N-terminal domain-containing protein [Polyangiaceae bacterium]